MHIHVVLLEDELPFNHMLECALLYYYVLSKRKHILYGILPINIVHTGHKLSR